MDAITDLSSQAVSFIVVLQDVCRNKLPSQSQQSDVYLWYMRSDFDFVRDKCTEEQTTRINEIVWSSDPSLKARGLSWFWEVSDKLLHWLRKFVPNERLKKSDFLQLDGVAVADFSPYQWRTTIRKILYAERDERLILAEILHYMPLQVILCLGAKNASIYRQRLYQVWQTETGPQILSSADLSVNQKWWDMKFKDGESRKTYVQKLLQSNKELCSGLVDANNPLSFEILLHNELNEIYQSREKRQFVDQPPFGDTPDLEIARQEVHDPLERAEKMNLVGLALSGGGIRSATFNLGILQHLAEKKMLHRIDYLSTVSGGGYIGSWLISWIKHLGFLGKVTDRLDPKKSADPMAEEVRPVRWLRMYSNYLTPQSSIMSADSWTLGVTWLRNTLINQSILLLLLCSVLALVNFIFYSWTHLIDVPANHSPVYILLWSTAMILPPCVIAGLGMHMYNSDRPPQSLFNLGKSRFLSLFLVGCAILSGFFISAWLYASARETSIIDTGNQPFLWVWFRTFYPASMVAILGILIIAFFGRYHELSDHSNPGRRVLIVRSEWGFAIILSSIIASAAGTIILFFTWEFFGYIIAMRGRDAGKLLFTLGLPIILEIFSFVVVFRMAIMGRLFPDARREWWGRMGAIVHRFSLIWILTCIAALYLLQVFKKHTTSENIQRLIVVIGGWSAMIGFAVNTAYNSSGKKEKGNGINIKDKFIRFAPYLFMVGFVLGGCYLLAFIFRLAELDFGESNVSRHLSMSLLITLGSAVLTLLLAWRVGVNEFSLHYFYRNRLVRAYLGATRRRADRNKTVNNFTGFDMKDDCKLASFVSTSGYFGPYPILNAALNATVVSELDRQDRKAESFIFSPLYCGFDFSPTRSTSLRKNKVNDYGYRPTGQYAYEGGPTLGTALAISGAAVNPNMGYHSSAATAFLLTVFNVRMGWWMGNPRRNNWTESDPKAGIAYIINDLIGKSNVDSNYVCLSDGGHFDNMGLYELIRRRCGCIILADAEEDKKATCEGLANAIRRCWIDFGAEISIDVNPILNKESHFIIGAIKYAGQKKPGKLIYIKTVLTGDESSDIREYYMDNPLFPNESTGDQFFDEAQFESYRKLGYHSLKELDLSIL